MIFFQMCITKKFVIWLEIAKTQLSLKLSLKIINSAESYMENYLLFLSVIIFYYFMGVGPNSRNS